MQRVSSGGVCDAAATSPAERSLVGRGCVVVTMGEQLGENPVAVTVRTWCRRAGFINRAEVLVATGRKREALADLEHAVTIARDPDSPLARKAKALGDWPPDTPPRAPTTGSSV